MVEADNLYATSAIDMDVHVPGRFLTEYDPK